MINKNVKMSIIQGVMRSYDKLEKVFVSSQRDNMCYFWKFGKWLICWISRVVDVTEKCLI